MSRNVLAIINPIAGQDYPILSAINRAFHKTDVEWDVRITKQKGDAFAFAQESLKDPSLDLVTVYGGDGTTMEVARGLAHSSLPLLILPGGTANVMAKELNQPLRVSRLLRAYVNNAYQTQAIDMGRLNDTPFLIRVNFGILADMVLDTSRDQKFKYGRLAYGLTAAEKLLANNPNQYRLHINGETIETEGLGLMVTNVGNVGFPGYSLHPDISATDGKLDVVVLRGTDLGTLVDLAKTTLLNVPSTSGLLHWQASELTLEVDPQATLVCDDECTEADTYHFQSIPQALKLVVPTIT